MISILKHLKKTFTVEVKRFCLFGVNYVKHVGQTLLLFYVINKKLRTKNYYLIYDLNKKHLYIGISKR